MTISRTRLASQVAITLTLFFAFSTTALASTPEKHLEPATPETVNGYEPPISLVTWLRQREEQTGREKLATTTAMKKKSPTKEKTDLVPPTRSQDSSSSNPAIHEILAGLQSTENCGCPWCGQLAPSYSASRP